MLGLLLLSPAACEAPPEDGGKVIRILDGDSLIVRKQDGTDLEVRLFGIDAPEYRQPWSRRSREALEALAGDRWVRVDLVTVDVYGRSVAVIRRASDGLEVGREMVRLGHAWVYRRYTDDETLFKLEDEARAAGRGLWSLSQKEREAPWLWRRKNRTATSGERPE